MSSRAHAALSDVQRKDVLAGFKRRMTPAKKALSEDFRRRMDTIYGRLTGAPTKRGVCLWAAAQSGCHRVYISQLRSSTHPHTPSKAWFAWLGSVEREVDLMVEVRQLEELVAKLSMDQRERKFSCHRLRQFQRRFDDEATAFSREIAGLADSIYADDPLAGL